MWVWQEAWLPLSVSSYKNIGSICAKFNETVFYAKKDANKVGMI